MLNEKGIRELAYVVNIDAIEPIPGKDRVECARVGGWTVMVRKEQFKPGDTGIYFEVDSKVPETEPFAFLEGKHYKIKTQGYRNPDGSKFYSQGLLMSFEDLGMEPHPVGTFLTEELKVTYADPEDVKRKGSGSGDKYKKMAARHPKLFKNPVIKWFYKRNWGKKLLFAFFGKKRDAGSSFPSWCKRTDEERVQNLGHCLEDFAKMIWIATEKIDGTSTTFTLKGRGRKADFRVCSRNVCFTADKQNCYYDTNVYTEMAQKYDMRTVCEKILAEHPELDFVTIQGETYGEGIQKRSYSMKEHDLAIFNVIFGYPDGKTTRLNPVDMTIYMKKFGVPCVPVVSEEIEIPANCDEILAMAGGASAIDGLPREGLVFRSLDGVYSFKAVDNEFLLKYHG